MIPQFKVLVNKEVGEMLNPVFSSGYIGQGPKVNDFEAALKNELKFEHAVTVNSATSALWLALHLIGVKPGDKVISTPMTCSATNEVIELIGAQIIWADIDEYGNIDPVDVGRKIGPDVKAVMAVDWGGVPCDYDELRRVCHIRFLSLKTLPTHISLNTKESPSLERVATMWPIASRPSST
jgi:dTDP-4-amino-4,6-dideoxygalactose transaminase